MDIFIKTKAIRLRSHLNKYLVANEDQETVSQAHAGSSRRAMWFIELVEGKSHAIRLKSCYGKYLTASDRPFLLGMIGRKVTQSIPDNVKSGASSSMEWEPIKGGFQVKLRTKNGKFLCANGGTVPWRNSITHDSPLAGGHKGWVSWGVEAVEVCADYMPVMPNQSPEWSSKESNHSEVSSPQKIDGRTIYYHVATVEYDDEDEATDGYALTFKGNGVDELTRRLEEETGLENIIVCTRSPLDRQLYPLRLQLPPNTTMHVVIVPPSSIV